MKQTAIKWEINDKFTPQYASRRNTCAQTWAAWDSPHEMQRPILYESKAFKREKLLLERFLNGCSLWIV